MSQLKIYKPSMHFKPSGGLGLKATQALKYFKNHVEYYLSFKFQGSSNRIPKNNDVGPQRFGVKSYSVIQALIKS